MPLTVDWAGDTKSYSVPEEGRYVTRISAIEQVMGKKYQSEETEPQFQIDYETIREQDENGNPYRIRQWINLGRGYDPTNDKAHLTKFVNGVFGRAFTKEQILQVDWEKFIGKTVAVMVEHTATGKAKVTKVSAAKGKELQLKDVAKADADTSIMPDTDDDLGDPFADE